jgi:hypothetical protein
MTRKTALTSSQYGFDSNGNFVIKNFNHAKTFSNFFPGVAGVWGIPMWVFYVNRGQAISSFGIESKDKAILEFLPANKAYRLTSLQGFRTFIKVRSGSKTIFWEPFQGEGHNEVMVINAHELTIQDEHKALGLKISVNYFTLPGESFAALVRSVTMTNVSKKSLDVEIVDGLPIILPYGMRDWTIKNMSRTVEAWVKVRNIKEKAPFYQLNVEVADTPDVKYIKEGNFYFSFLTGPKSQKLLDPVVEAAAVFGDATDFVKPQRFLASSKFSLPARQETASRTPSAMSFAKIKIAPKVSREIVSVIGQTYALEHLHAIVKQVTGQGYIDQKRVENRTLVASIKDYALTSSSSPAFDQYCGQTFLDNILRGGLPVTVKTSDGNIAFNVFSRKHGDPERDYNYFVLSPTYFSQGNGNYRDVNQNRRNDVWFNTDVKDASVIDFWNLSQADGFNPLIVKGMTFSLADPEHLETILQDLVKGACEPLRMLLQKSFGPGEVLKCVFENQLTLRGSPEEFLEKLLSHCQRQITADHGEGFWSDHWTYNLDLVESYLGVYPDHSRSLLLEKKVFSFYHNSHYLAPRTDRYILTDKGVRQYHAVVDGSKEIHSVEQGSKLRIKNGEGEVYHTNLLVKMLCLVTNKAASFDPSGVGLEMEGDKPNWYDSLNGLPGLLGSSLSETLELKRLSQFLLERLDGLHIEHDKVAVFVELAEFIKGLSSVSETEKETQAMWHKVNDVKEHYRQAIRKGIDGKEEDLSVREIHNFLKMVIERCRQAVEKAATPEGLLTTYFYHEVVDFAPLDKAYQGQPYVLPVAFKRHNLPLFLEGFVHALKVNHDHKHAAALYAGVRKSGLFDRKLKMYKVNADITSESEEIGRTRIFPRGWLENESVWLHMQYKYLLEILRSGLYSEFYATIKDVMIPFLKPEVYGRSTLENSSFIASSSHEDKSFHGQGFVARLSGSTAEFLHMWLVMNAGAKPFHWDNKKGLTLTFKPSLAGWLFSKEERDIVVTNQSQVQKAVRLPKNTYAFNFLGSTLVVYHNPSRRDTFGEKAVVAREIVIRYSSGLQKPIELTDATIPTLYAQDIRENKVERIDVKFA